MRKEQSNLQSGNQDELPPEMLRSGSMGSSLNKFLKKDTKIPVGKEWARDLIGKIPYDQLEIVANFIKTVPPDQAERAGKELFNIINDMATGILRSPDQKQALEECLEQVKKRLEN